MGVGENHEQSAYGFFVHTFEAISSFPLKLIWLIFHVYSYDIFC
nr:MAG TPA: hypothetical protein [Caudoviricetes sp.]